jgi:hypothetical protein
MRPANCAVGPHVVGALGVRAGMMVAVGTGRRLRPVPRFLLYGETALDALPVVTDFWT